MHPPPTPSLPFQGERGASRVRIAWLDTPRAPQTLASP